MNVVKHFKALSINIQIEYIINYKIISKFREFAKLCEVCQNLNLKHS